MKKVDDEEYQIVSELSHHYMDDDDSKLTPGQAKAVIVLISLMLIATVVFIILSYDYKNAELLRQEQALEDKLEEEQIRREEILEEADELCLTRVKNYTYDDVLELEPFLYSYKLELTPDGWTDGKTTLAFDFETEAAPALVYYDNNGEVWQRSLTRSQNADDYYAKIGKEMLTLSSNDIKAIGRVLIGDTSCFTRIE